MTKNKSDLHPFSESFIKTILSEESVHSLFLALQLVDDYCNILNSTKKKITLTNESFSKLDHHNIGISGDSMALAMIFHAVQNKLIKNNQKLKKKKIFATGAIRTNRNKYYIDRVAKINQKISILNYEKYDSVILPSRNWHQIKLGLKNKFTSIGPNITVNAVINLILKLC